MCVPNSRYTKFDKFKIFLIFRNWLLQKMQFIKVKGYSPSYILILEFGVPRVNIKKYLGNSLNLSSQKHSESNITLKSNCNQVMLYNFLDSSQLIYKLYYIYYSTNRLPLFFKWFFLLFLDHMETYWILKKVFIEYGEKPIISRKILHAK